MKKIAFVTPWYGENIPGGAEMELRELAKHLQAAGTELEILTTCVKDFNSDWSKNFHKEGCTVEGGISVRRFSVRERNTQKFDAVNAKLMNDFIVSKEEEKIFMEEMVNSPALYKFIEENKEAYSWFVYIPYMFGTTLYGILACPEKAVLIPCFHDESYLYFELFKELFPKIKGLVYNAQPEYILANKVYSLDQTKQMVAGIGMDTEIDGDEKNFRNKFNINDPYILYAGRKDVGKNIYTLIKYFAEYKKRTDTKLKLVLIGGGKVDIPTDLKTEIIDLGFVDKQDKYNACAGAVLLCQPSLHESFSYVIMESWLCGRPVLVHDKCEVTKHFAIESKGGLYFSNYFEFEGCLNYLIENSDIANLMGQNGKKFVKDNFAWEVVLEKYNVFFEELLIKNY